MALLNTSPDSIYFQVVRARDEFLISRYEEFLRYAQEKYERVYGSTLPRDIGRFHRSGAPRSSSNSRKKICMLSYSIYEHDNRVRRYAEALAKRGDHVDVIALAGGTVSLGTEVISGVTVHRIQRRDRNEKGKWTYAWRLIRFFLYSSLVLARRHQRIRYDLIHIHNPPDFLAFAGIYPKYAGAKLILDIHDIVPELFASKFNAMKNNLYVRLLKAIEKKATAFVDHVIVSNDLWHEKLIARAVPKEKSSVFLNNVDPAIFYRRQRTRNDGKFIVLFPGSFQWHQGIDLAIEAFAAVKAKVPTAEFHIYGGGPEKSKLVQLTERLGLTESVRFFEFLPLDQMADVIANSDLGIVPKRGNSFKNEAYSTKIMEFMSQGVPVVLSRTRIDSFYFDDSIVQFFASGDVESMTDAMIRVIQDRKLRESLINNAYEYADRNSWALREKDYFDLVDSLSFEVHRK